MSLNAVSTATLSSVLRNNVSQLQSQLATLEQENSTGQLADIGLTLAPNPART